MNELRIKRKGNETDDDALARHTNSPANRAANTVQAYTPDFLKGDINAHIKHLNDVCDSEEFNSEKMLISQAHTLDAIFNRLAEMATLNFNNSSVCSALLNNALRAQDQCSKTIARMNELKNPKRATFIKQLNQANQMQVNNSENFADNSNELFTRGENGANLDTRTTIETIASHSSMATLDEVHRGKNSDRKRKVKNECV